MGAVSILAILLSLSGTTARAQTTRNGSDRKAIEAMAAAWQSAWNRHDVDALVSLMSEDVDFITVLGAGGWLRGRKEFKDRHIQIHQTMFRESMWATKDTHIKFIRRNLAIVHVLWETKGDVIPGRSAGEPRGGIFTWVLEKLSGKWLIIASQNTENRQPTTSQGALPQSAVRTRGSGSRR